jgi:hypothetical protein
MIRERPWPQRVAQANPIVPIALNDLADRHFWFHVLMPIVENSDDS